MGVWVDHFVGPESGAALSRAAFEALLVDLIRSRIVDPPCAIVSGDFKPDMPLGISNAAQSLQVGESEANDLMREILGVAEKKESLTLAYKGSRSVELLAALRALEWGKADVAVWFSSLVWSNDQLRKWIERDGANGDVVVYAMRKKSKLQLNDGGGDDDADDGDPDDDGGRTIELTTYFALTGKGCPYDLTRSPIEAVLKRHFGKRLVSGTAFS